MLLLYFPETLC